MRSLIFSLTTSLTVFLAFDPTYARDMVQNPLVKIHADIIKDYPQVSHISPSELEARLAKPNNNLVIFDTRPAKEYDVSHIKDAIQLDPNAAPKAFLNQFGPQISGKTVIVYCSVGRRSTRLGSKLTDAILQSNAVHLYNLEGGLFDWHNNDRELVNASGKTRAIHPYNLFWGRLIEEKEQISYSPK